ncbi:cyclic lactone autoinducer peptide [Asaccharospora irregularis]|uniref:Cyclic lactone autoinducer peptide n=1 Tax=Asaccharospora irregularis DSM 2635 TaxID=1121321 RepID=A0A1M5MIF4_9FIRM|nr:cyclic lactone autoinducer peptide [Asaccharospora irregularis]SHG76937.1 cyclic lactone autoinducer peptide [Asaccharospora irregularis DSM 2635]
MKFLMNAVSGTATRVAGGVATFCMFFFFEPEVPKSLREE